MRLDRHKRVCSHDPFPVSLKTSRRPHRLPIKEEKMKVAVEFGLFLTGQLWNFERLILFDNNSAILACFVFESGVRTYKVYIE